MRRRSGKGAPVAEEDRRPRSQPDRSPVGWTPAGLTGCATRRWAMRLAERPCPGNHRCATTPCVGSRRGHRPRRGRSSETGCAISAGRRRHPFRMPKPRSLPSASSTTTPSGRSRRSSRPTSTGSPGPSATIRTWSPPHGSSRRSWIVEGSHGGPIRWRSDEAARPDRATLATRGAVNAADRSNAPEMRDRPPIPEGDHDADEIRAISAAAPTTPPGLLADVLLLGS